LKTDCRRPLAIDLRAPADCDVISHVKRRRDDNVVTGYLPPPPGDICVPVNSPSRTSALMFWSIELLIRVMAVINVARVRDKDWLGFRVTYVTVTVIVGLSVRGG